MSDWTGGTCPRSGECTFYQSVTPNPVARVKYATMFPYCKLGRHESCMRWWAMENCQPVPEDLLPDGGRDIFAAEARGAASSGAQRVLVVDDMPLFRKSLTGLVANVGSKECEITEADSAERALVELMKEPGTWTLVVTDYNMGEMNGFELIQSMRSHPQLAGVPAIVFSSESDAGVQDKCSSLPRVRWLSKKPDRAPFDSAWRDLVVDRKL